MAYGSIMRLPKSVIAISAPLGVAAARLGVPAVGVRRSLIALVALGTLAVPSGYALGLPGVISPPEGGTVTQASDAIVLEPHDGLVGSIWIAPRPETTEQVLGQPPGSGDPRLYWWSARLGYLPGSGGLYHAATIYPLSQAFTSKRNTHNVSYKEYVTLTPGQRYYYQVEWNSLYPGMGHLSPIRSFVVAAPPPPPAITSVAVFTALSVKAGASALRSRVTLPGPGGLSQWARSTGSNRVRVCDAVKTVSRASTVLLLCPLTRAAKQALLNRSLRVRVITAFTPTGGVAQWQTKIIRLGARRATTAGTG